ncbi:peptide-methionine (S)-S-oxide reductase MsrA [Synechococcus sp. CCY 9618]|uniref:peptide-methionine (S)-S-oxide reductase MsrA n=1 Tax=Synechococcus sp. CCY 9618 TaxID=2815602 RepID=UPI0020B21929|nr:peptide-methionine (S)-S-oxide reductase MsrA [Synechococcus sp. CCY 9618]
MPSPLQPLARRAAAGGLITAGLLAAGLLAAAVVPRLQAASAKDLPDPAVVETSAGGSTATATAVLAGGCFWGMEAVFEHVKGVTEVVTGYAGGPAATADYEQVSNGNTGHAEGIRITYDPAKVSYGQLLKVFFAVAHDPTELNRQGPDVGSQYRSAIFPADPEQRRVATAYIVQLNRSGVFPQPIATTVETWRGFTPAEAYHQDFVARNPTHPYVVFHDKPKVARLEAEFPGLYR